MTNETTTETTPMESVDISVNQTKVARRTFIGEIVVDAIEPAKVFNTGDSGYQWHLAVKPLSFNLRGETGAFHDWAGIKYSGKTGELIKTGEFGRVNNAARDVFRKELTQRGIELRKLAVAQAQLDGQDTSELTKKDPMDFVKVGKGHFLGLQGEFAYEVLEYGKTKTGEVMRGGRESLIAIRTVKPEEVAVAQAQVTGVATPADLEYTQEQVDTLLQTMVGKKPGEYMRGLGRSGLSGEVVGAITNGKGLAFLQSKNLVTVDTDGTVRAA